jgi:CIC family chloride channel protein
MASDPRGTEQANVPALSANPSLRFWCALVGTGIAAGIGAIVMMAVLRAVQHAAFDYHRGTFSGAAAAHSDARRLAVLAVGGVVAGVGWWVLRERAGGNGGDPTEAVWSGKGRLSLPRTLVDGVLSEVVIGLGASLGREAAPQHAGAAAGSQIGQWLSLPREQLVVLVACGAGAGVGAVYNVPLAGALFAAELYLGSLSLVTLVPALVCSAIATAIAWLSLGQHPVYQVAHLGYPALSLVVFALVSGPVVGVLSAGYVRLVGWSGDHRPKRWRLVVEPIVALSVLGVVAMRYPLLLGNGRDLAQYAFSTKGAALATLAALMVLKPLVTSMCLRSGAAGGLFTPTFSFGAVTGALLGHLWVLVWPGAPGADFAVVGSAAMLAAAMQSPVAAIAFAIELTNTIDPAMVAVLLAVAGAVIVSRRLEVRSIYSARLARPHSPRETPRTPRPPQPQG